MKSKKAISDRIKRIKGQIGGIEKMIDQNKPCTEIVQQLQAASSAIKSVIIAILKDEICYSINIKEPESLEKKLKLLFKIN